MERYVRETDVDDLIAENERLRTAVKSLEERLDNELKCNRAITRTYKGMRARLKMAFGMPEDSEREEKGLNAGLEGHVDWAIAEHARIRRLCDRSTESGD